MMYRLVMIKGSDDAKADPPTARPFKEHPNLTKLMRECTENGMIKGYTLGLFYAGCIFIQSEGVGLVIYFLVSASCDNFTIYFANSEIYCQYIMQVAIYSMALVTFLPNCVIAFLCQGKCYDQGKWFGLKSVFILVMVIATVTSFFVRLSLVYNFGWADFIDQRLQHFDYKVLVAILVPPAVDGCQTMLLLLSALKAAEGPEENFTLVSDAEDNPVK